MTSEEVAGLVEYELAMHGMMFAGHGVGVEEILRFCVRPQLIPVLQGAGGEPVPMWVVLDEQPDGGDGGVLILYHEEDGTFGLGRKGAGAEPVRYLSPCGSFLDALLAI